MGEAQVDDFNLIFSCLYCEQHIILPLEQLSHINLYIKEYTILFATQVIE